MTKLIHVIQLVFVLVVFPAFMFGQKTLTGKVTDSATGDPLAGASVLVVGTTTGAFTGQDGSFRIVVPDGSQTIRVTYLGYVPQEFSADADDILIISMISENITTDEVVIIGYGSVKKDDATGSVQAIKSEYFNKGNITSPQELLAGKVAGVQITTGGDPGGGSTIRIRGGSSLSATNDPLIVIDGVPVASDDISGSRNPLNIVNPNDIETFTVLKDASATAIYGSRASNGVIMITTKKGSLGKKVSVNYNGSIAFSNRINEIDVLSADEFRSLINTRYADGHPARTLLGTANTDWQSEIFQTATFHDHNVSLAGGIGNVPYRVSLGYTDKEGILKTDHFGRTTAAINVNPKFLNNMLQVNVGLKTMFSRDQFANQGAIGSAVSFDPTKPVRDDNSQYGGFFTWTQANGNPNTLAPANPVALLEMRDDRSNVTRYIANVTIDYRFWFLPDLRANLNLGYDHSRGEGTVDVPANAAFAFVDGGRKQEYWQEKNNELLEFYLNYNKTLGSSTIDVMGGYSWQHFFRDNYNFSTSADGSKILQPENTFPKEYYLVSLFGRVNYTLMEKFLFTFTLRRDGTSRFSEDNRWGMFPAAAFAWKVLDNSEAKFSRLKLRLGYGITGQQDIGGDYYPYLARYQSSLNNAQYQFGNDFISTLRPNGYDANIKWEETTTYNIALDYGFLRNRIYGSIEYYRRTTTDLLNFIPVPAGTNLTNFITTNVGDLENNGVEFSINVIPVMKDNFTWDIGFNVTANTNEITRLTASEDPNYPGVLVGGIGGGVGNTIQIHSVGYPANSYYVWEQVYDEAGVPIEGLYVDRNEDGQITLEDRYRLEKPAPDAFFGFTSLLNYKNLFFSFAGRANVGNYVYNNILSDYAFYNRLYNSTGIINNAHSDITAIDFAVPQYFSDHFIQDASFLRLDNVTLGYNFSNIFGGKGYVKLSATVQNPVLFTQYQGLDPEVFNGIDGNIYPRSRTFMIGLNAGF
ncbi:MAG: SusC/RagA family TonB-linked outer membrane protein [Bacteroidia bacterium]|nr:SusC/RagA family TonB-linked outer membrane protein [Bacteroidia bacterium]